MFIREHESQFGAQADGGRRAGKGPRWQKQRTFPRSRFEARATAQTETFIPRLCPFWKGSRLATIRVDVRVASSRNVSLVVGSRASLDSADGQRRAISGNHRLSSVANITINEIAELFAYMLRDVDRS